MNGSRQTNPNDQPAWFPHPGQTAAATADDQPGRKLKDSLSAIRPLLPLPLELINDPDPADLSGLAEKIRMAGNARAVIALAHTLTSREINQVFPLLAATAATAPSNGTASRPAEHLISSLTLIIRERACLTLYGNGWLAFQKFYPSQPVGRALAVLCRILEIKQQSGDSKTTPAGARLSADQDLISQLAQPDHRHFIRRLIRRFTDLEMTLDQLMRQYRILPELPLGIALIAQSFLSDDAAIYQDGHKLFARLLQQADLDTRAALLHHLFSLRNLPPNIRNLYCQQIYRYCGKPADGNPVWTMLKSKDQRDFQHWILMATIGTHCRNHPEKAHLYLDYAARILKVEPWDDDTLLLYFRRFVIADSRRHPLLAIYYEQPADGGQLFELATREFNPNPANPAIPHRQVDDAIRHATLQGTIGLPFDAEGIRLTRVFLDLCLHVKPGRRQTRQKMQRWFSRGG